MKRLLICVAAAGALCGCGHNSKSVAEESAGGLNSDSTLVLYYSQTGATEKVAQELGEYFKCDVTKIEPVKPYDGDYPATIQRWREEVEHGVKVELQPIDVDFDKYTTIFLGYPIWGGTYALPMGTFLVDNSLAGKKVVTFATFGSGGIDSSTRDVASIQPEAEVVQGYGVRNARVAKSHGEIYRFLVENGYMAGEIEPLPDYSEYADVSEADIAIFDQACGNYQFPLGTPVKVGSRQTPEGIDYRYDVLSTSPDGTPSKSTIYVTVVKDSLPEFTEVVRH